MVLDDGRYIMQLRDDKEGIFYPGHWGCFGGAIEDGETPDIALRRELKEELGFLVPQANRFTQFDFDFCPFGQSKVRRIYYEVAVTRSAYHKFDLQEGADVRAFDGATLLAEQRVTPYDAFAIWMHINQALISRRP